MKSEIVFALDENLGFPILDENWQEFISKNNLKIENYDNMQLLTQVLIEREIGISYLPVANYYYLRNDGRYLPIANARTAKTHSSTMESVLVVEKNSDFNTIEELYQQKIGYIHPYCTTSYFALILLLKQKGFSIKNFFSEIVEVGAWQKQIDAVISGSVAATMVFKDVWLSNPLNAEKTRVIAEVTGLPTPLIIVNSRLVAGYLEEFKNMLFSNMSGKKNKAKLFSGFIPFEEKAVKNMLAEVSAVLD